MYAQDGTRSRSHISQQEHDVRAMRSLPLLSGLLGNALAPNCPRDFSHDAAWWGGSLCLEQPVRFIGALLDVGLSHSPTG